MRRNLRILSIMCGVGAAVFWMTAGAHCGWTMTRVPRPIVDEVAGIQGVVYVKKFVPGVDFLGAAALESSLLWGASFLFRKKNTGNPKRADL
jgi:hypothetical protein